MAQPTKKTKKNNGLNGCRHSSMDSSLLTILPPMVRIPTNPCMLLSFVVKLVIYLSCWKKRKFSFMKNIGFKYFLTGLSLQSFWVKKLTSENVICQWTQKRCLLRHLRYRIRGSAISQNERDLSELFSFRFRSHAVGRKKMKKCQSLSQ